MITKKNLYLPLLSIILFAACKKSDVNQNKQVTTPKVDTDVYVAGWTKSANNHAIATYWKNGVAVKLSDSTADSYINAIVINGNDVYVVGYQLDVSYIPSAICWKNNAVVPLANSSNSVARAVIINNGDIDICGLIAESTNAALYWKNGTPLTINAVPGFTNPFAITANGDDIYVAGQSVLSDNTTAVATYWKNGSPNQLTNQYSYAYGIAVNGNDVYVAGDDASNRQTPKAAYWKNGTETILSSSSFASSVVVSDNDVYIGGQTTQANGNTVAAYWKNGILNPVSSIISTTQAIAISDGNVYLAGSQNISATSNVSQAVYWKNGVAVPLAKSGQALGIAVVTHPH